MKCRACGSDTNFEDWYWVQPAQQHGQVCYFWASRRHDRQIKVRLMACPICNTTKIVGEDDVPRSET